MGSGKTTVGKQFAKKLGVRHIDTDKLIEKKAGQKIGKIFAEYGEVFFRELEHDVIKDLPPNEPLVISIGGRAIVNQENLKILKQLGIIVWLKASPEEIYKRVKKNLQKRPLLNIKNLNKIECMEKIERILLIRESYYNIADYKIETDNKTIDEIVDEIYYLLTSI